MLKTDVCLEETHLVLIGLKSLKVEDEITKINIYLDQFWQQEEGSADASHQMVGLCGYKNVLLSCIWYILGSL